MSVNDTVRARRTDGRTVGVQVARLVSSVSLYLHEIHKTKYVFLLVMRMTLLKAFDVFSSVQRKPVPVAQWAKPLLSLIHI